MALYYSITALINGIASLCLAIFVFVKNKNSSINKGFALFCLAVAFWSLSLFIWSLARNEVTTIIWARILLIGAIWIPPTFLNFVFLLIGNGVIGKIRNKIILNIVYFFAFTFTLISFNPNFVAGVRQELEFRFWPIPGFAFALFLLYFIFIAIYSHMIMYKEMRFSTTKSLRGQIRYVAIGTFFGFIGGATNYFLYYNIPVPPFANILVLLFVCTIAYAIVRHQLMDIKVLIKKTLVFTGLLVSVIAILLLPAILFQAYLFRGVGVGGRTLGLIAGGIVIIFTMTKIKGFLINITDKYLFQKKYDYKELLKTFTGEVLTVHNLDQLLKLTVNKLVDIVRVTSCAVLLYDKERGRFLVAASHSVNDPLAVFGSSDEIAITESSNHSYFLMSDNARKQNYMPEVVKDVGSKLSGELIVPMALHGKAIGILSLGKKKSDEGYTQDDLDILLPLARTLAIAISNAELFEELGKTQAEAAQKEKMAVIGTLAAGMAHEIRNPITTIKIFTEFLKERKDDPRFIEKFEKLVPKEIEKINDMITHLLEFSKPADYKSMEPVDLREPLSGVLEILEAEMTLSDIVLKENVTSIPPVYGNKKYVQEILFNIIQNAIHAIGRRGIISVEAEDMGKHVEVRVTDTGCGITEGHVQHIFEPFFTTKMDSEGVGLGLYVIKQLMLRMDGNISVKSIVGKGTTFCLSFIKA